MFSRKVILAAVCCVNAILPSWCAAISSDTIDSYSFEPFLFEARTVTKSKLATSSNGSTIVIEDVSDLEYKGKINVGGQDFEVVLDTGSSDLWVYGGKNVHITKHSGTKINVTYGLGSVYGEVVYGPVKFGGYSINQQAYIYASNLDQMKNTSGIFGLGFNGLSDIWNAVPNGMAPLSNIFAQNSSLSPFIGLALERSNDQETTAGGSLSIGQYDPRFSNISQAAKYPVVPQNTTRWTITLNGMQVNGHNVPLNSSVSGAQPNTAVALIDSGTSLAYIPPSVSNAIYSSINGSVSAQNDGQQAWFVPCLNTANVSFTFGQDTFAINPLELTFIDTIVQSGKNYTVCIGTFQGPLGVADSALDFLLGDVWMRNVYSVFNFGKVDSTGENSGNASIQFFSRTTNQSYNDFVQQRNKTLQGYPPLLDLTNLHSNGVKAN